MRQEQYDTTDFVDSYFNDMDEDPLVAYKARISYKGQITLSESPCVWTHLSYCYEKPQIDWMTASVTGEFDDHDCAVVKLQWASAGPVGSINYFVSPGSPVVPYDNIGTVAYYSAGAFPNNTEVTFMVKARDLRTGCESGTSATTVVPPCSLTACPTETGEIEAFVNVIGRADNQSANIKIQLVWGGSTGQTTYIYKKDNSCSTNLNDFTLHMTLPGETTSLEDIIPSGVKVTYKILSKTVCGGTTYTVGRSNCIEVTSNGPVTGTGAGTKYFYITDHLGTVRAILDENGNIKSTHDYEPYGVELLPAGADDTDMKYRFTGQERDRKTNLDYFHARFFTSSMGRFTRPDPGSDISEYDPQSWNQYAYVRGNPVNATDPTGMIIDTIADIGFIIYDLSDIAASVIADDDISGTQWSALGADTLAAAIPFATGAGMAVRAATKTEKVIDAVKAGEKVVDLAKETTAVKKGAKAVEETSEATKVATRNRYGSKGNPDHQDAVKKAISELKSDAAPGETVLSEKRIRVDGSRRIPDGQLLDEQGVVKKVVEVERRPNSTRHKNRLLEYDELGVVCETKSVK